MPMEVFPRWMRTRLSHRNHHNELHLQQHHHPHLLYSCRIFQRCQLLQQLRQHLRVVWRQPQRLHPLVRRRKCSPPSLWPQIKTQPQHQRPPSVRLLRAVWFLQRRPFP
uniref:(northern house mosquito) hypothetical protein n=1 Tax=Culex pipiens TaxID=7175 RepID=A0A8D8HQS6_CULPI